MRISKQLSTILFTLVLSSSALGQAYCGYQYQRPITGISDSWHSITLPNELVGKLTPNLSDLRILGVTKSGDTLEAPYIVRQGQEIVSLSEIPFKIINRSHNELGYFFTFEVPNKESLNSISLNFSEQNFDWNINLEGSQDNSTWFTIVENYRILSIHNSLTQYTFSEVDFPDAKFRYLRVLVKTNHEPKLTTAKLCLTKVTKGNYRSYGVLKPEIVVDAKQKQTAASVKLDNAVPVSTVRLWINSKYDYYRPITISYVSDSSNTQKGTIYSYETLYSGTLTSLEKSIFTFDSRVAQSIRITIDNYDNQPLNIDSVEVLGNVYELVARFTEPASYFLAYGNHNADTPTYDIGQFTDKIPAELKRLELGAEVENGVTLATSEPLFQNKLWLWAIIIVVGAVLGWFTFRMMKQK